MISCLAVERPGRWRLFGVIGIFALALAPVLCVVPAAGLSSGGNDAAWLDFGFGTFLMRSLFCAGTLAGIAVLVGLPVGVLAGLYEFPLRRFLLGLLALPLLVPSFLWAIGLSTVRVFLGLPSEGFLSGFTGVLIAFSAMSIPLVVFVTLIAARGISQSQADAAWLSGGEGSLFWQVSRNIFPVSVLAGVLAGVLSLSEPGPGQILGYYGAASQILITFSAQYDFGLAARQCLLLSLVALGIIIPVVACLAPRLADGLLARDTHPVSLRPVGGSKWGLTALVSALIVLLIGGPLLGLVLPLFKGPQLAQSLSEASRTLGDTLVYGVTAGLGAVFLGASLAILAGRGRRMRTLVLAGLLVVFSLPPSLGALGLVHAGTNSPAIFDFILRSRFTVGIWLALHLFPLASLFAMRRWGNASPSWSMAGAVHGVPLSLFLAKVVCPWLLPAAVLAGLLTMLLAVGDVGSALLLVPPGAASLPLAIFTVMANAPEALVSSLCLIYIGGGGVILAAIGILIRITRAKQ